MKKSTLLLAAVIVPLGIGSSHAAVTMTINRNDGSWSASATAPFDVAFATFFSTYSARWLDPSVTGPGLTSSSAPFSYTGTYNGSSISGSATLIVGSVTGSGIPRDFALDFGGSLGVTGTFTALNITPNAPLTNPFSYNNIQSGAVTPINPIGNAPAQINVIPEPGTTLLGGLTTLLLFQRRRRA